MKSDYGAWLDEIYKNPLVGDDLGGGVRKIRMTIADKGKGKSGGARILTLNVKVSEDGMNVTLLTIYGMVVNEITALLHKILCRYE